MYRYFSTLLGARRRSVRPLKERLSTLQRRLRVERLEDRTLLAVDLSLSGAQTLIAGPNLNVSNEPGALQVEMTLDVNPTNPLNLAGFSHRYAPDGQGGYDLTGMELYWSLNGGATWTITDLDETADLTYEDVSMRFDPSIAFDADGTLYVAYGVQYAGWSSAIVVGRRPNEAEPFEFKEVDASEEDTHLDKPHLATGFDPYSENQAVYVAYTEIDEQSWDYLITVAGCNDWEGEGFNRWAVINDGIPFQALEGFADPAVGPGGELYVAWHDHGDDVLLFDADLDGLWATENSFGSDVSVLGEKLNTSMWRENVPAQAGRLSTGPVLDVDRSGGENNGRLYIAYVDTPTSAAPFKEADIFLVSSDDHGSSWDGPFTVEDDSDNPLDPQEEPYPATDFLPWVDVDQTTGSVNVIYYTTENDPNSGPAGDEPDEVDVRLASSFNGGATFPSKVDLTTAMSNAGELPTAWGGGFLDYIGLAVHDGTAHALWADNGDRQNPGQYLSDFEAYTATVYFESQSGGNVLTVTGADAVDDQIDLDLSTANNEFLEVFLNGPKKFAGLAATIDRIDVYGRAGNDTLAVDAALAVPIHAYGEAGNDTLEGGAGNDILEGGAGNDTLEGGAGDDTYLFAGSGALGEDTIVESYQGGGDTSRDKLDFSSLAYAINLYLSSTTRQTVASNLDLTLAHGLGIEDVMGTYYNDMIKGNARDNELHGYGGNDTVYGGYGDDVLDGGDGSDQLFGEYNDDEIYGGDGDDYLDSGYGLDRLWGQGGNDYLNVVDGYADDWAIGGDGYDYAWGDPDGYGGSIDYLDAEVTYPGGGGGGGGESATGGGDLLGADVLTMPGDELIYGGLQDADTLARWRETLWFYLEWQKRRRA